ncbi:MAG: peptidylprolyl isomerase [Deltaproteobacteria bacterium]|nr:peptidylprolyl isomerase [Deltaproteobacteria bacterium]
MRAVLPTLLIALFSVPLVSACPAPASPAKTETKAKAPDAKNVKDAKAKTPDVKALKKRLETSMKDLKRPKLAKKEPLPAPTDVAAAPKDATVTASGLAYKSLKPGTGKVHPKPTDKVKVHYTGWTTNGKMFDSSVQRGRPATFPLNGVIKGWTEGLQLMVEGEKARFWIPGSLAYGDTPKRPGAPAGTLVFDVELMEIDKPIPAPADVAAVPADATKTASGLAYKVQKKGTGDAKPSATDTVEVHYTGWTLDGKMFDSSVKRGQTTSFPLNRVIKGWTEGLQLMVVGETTRFWIPGDLAYGDKPMRPGAPAGMLVFDVELVSIKK